MGAEAIVLAYTGALLSSFLQVLFDRMATPQFLNFFKRIQLSEDLLQKLVTLLLTVNKVLGDAEEKQITDPYVKQWLDSLRDAVYDAEDLLDVIATEDRRSQIEGGATPGEQVSHFNSRLDAIVKKLEVMVKQKDVLSLKEDGGAGKPYRKLPTTCLVDKSEVCLRETDKEHIRDFLLSVRGENIDVIAIIGMGGIGKTTLAQFLYHDSKVERHFNLKVWVYVSEEFDVLNVTKKIYESAIMSHCDFTDLNVLQVRLMRILAGRRFLLVLDNIWNESLREWDLLCRPLKHGRRGSKIIVTGRSQNVASTVRSVLVHYLKPLPNDICLPLFEKHAFGDHENVDPTLKEKGEQIVRKCRGLPLAVKTLGGLLHSEVEVEEWDNILNSKIWDLPYDKSDILPALKLSYHYLPSQLKPCFAYCSIFPKHHKFEKRDLIRMWIAEGLVQQPSSRRRTEEVGEQYFHELLSRSIFQKCDDPSFFMMHDLVNELAQHIAGEFCFKFEPNNTLQNPARVRHMSWITNRNDRGDKFVAFYGKNKVLRTFLPLRLRTDGKAPFDSTIFNRMFPQTSCLRVLSLSPYNLTEFPNSVGNFKQLRYLDLSGAAILCLTGVVTLYNLETLNLSNCRNLRSLPESLKNLTKLEHLDIKGMPIEDLPNSIGDLKELGYLDLSWTEIQSWPEAISGLTNLHTLKLSHCRNLTCLPTDMGNLTKLKHLDTKGTDIKNMPPSFCNLKRLQLLTNFAVSNNGRSAISEVKDLSLLRILTIINLQNVSQTADAECANLKDKKYLRELILEWGIVDPCNGVAQNAGNVPVDGNAHNAADGQNAGNDPNAQNAAKNPPHIDNTKNAMDDTQNHIGQHAGNGAQDRNAEHAANVLVKLQPGENLESLEIKNFFGVSLPNWLGYASFSKMKSLTLNNCPKCNSLPPLGQLPSLKELVVQKLAAVTIVGPEFYGNGDVAFKSLEYLSFHEMENWEQWLPFANQRGFPSINNLDLFLCQKLRDLPIQLPNSRMQIQRCDRLRATSQ